MLRAIHGQCTPNSIAVCENLKLPGQEMVLSADADFTVVVLPLICVRSPVQVTQLNNAVVSAHLVFMGEVNHKIR